jgi:N-formylglutamate deformylase
MDDPFVIVEPKNKAVPIILSVPHCGTAFPEELMDDYNPQMTAQPDDTDWFVNDLYDFVTDLGITIIHAKYSRWVIDLNRAPNSAPLYNDGRIITGLTTATDFFGNDIYTSKDKIPGATEIQRRLDNYYWPYYTKLEQLLSNRKAEHGKVLLWDAHSIRHYIPTIREEIFPDMILGNNDEKTAHASLINTAISNLQSGSFTVNHNDPFKGGHITRYFGRPNENMHALQLEMNKILYMDDEEIHYNESRAGMVREVLKRTFEGLITSIEKL